jgi:hypothetical protein
MALIDAWGNRYDLNPDGISYIELARAVATGGPHAAVNGYWSPGYPLLIAPVVALVRSGWSVLIPLLHAVNVVLCSLAVVLYVAVLQRLARPWQDDDNPVGRYATAAGIACGTAVAIESIGFGLLTPDIAVMLMVVATAECAITLDESGSAMMPFIAFGAILGAGYWIKGILLPLDVLLLALLILMPPRVERARMKLGVAGVVFALVCAPLIANVSGRLGRVTVGDVGRLNYAWAVDGVMPFIGWQGDSAPRFGVPSHPPRTLWPHPRTIEFATPVSGTYPLWYDPSYWYAGVRPRFDFAGQWSALRQGAADLVLVILGQWATILAMILIWYATVRDRGRSARSRMPVVLAVWAVGAALVYALVHVESRYLAGFILTLVASYWAKMMSRRGRRGTRWALAAALGMLTISVTVNLYRNSGGFALTYRPGYLAEADTLHRLGVGAGAPVAAIGDAFEQYAAFAGGTPIVAQVLDSTGFWDATPASRLAITERLSRIGVRALLANNVSPEMQAEGWHLIARPDSANLGILPLPRP